MPRERARLSYLSIAELLGQCGVSQAQLPNLSRQGVHIVLGCAVYILRGSDSVPVLSQERDSQSLLNQEEESGGPGPGGGEFLSACSGSSGSLS